MYLTYEEYQNMGGTLDESAFNDFEFEAETQVDWYTFNRLHNETTYPQRLPRLMYTLIKMAALKANLLGQGEAEEGGTIKGTIASQSNDGVSVSYNTLSAADAFKLCNDETGNIIKQYLQGAVNSLGRKLLYRGLYPGE